MRSSISEPKHESEKIVGWRNLAHILCAGPTTRTRYMLYRSQSFVLAGSRLLE